MGKVVMVEAVRGKAKDEEAKVANVEVANVGGLKGEVMMEGEED